MILLNCWKDEIGTMKKSMQVKIANSLSSKTDLNKKALQLKKSWDEVGSLLKGKPKKK